jgi:hypothetical protein
MTGSFSVLFSGVEEDQQQGPLSRIPKAYLYRLISKAIVVSAAPIAIASGIPATVVAVTTAICYLSHSFFTSKSFRDQARPISITCVAGAISYAALPLCGPLDAAIMGCIVGYKALDILGIGPARVAVKVISEPTINMLREFDITSTVKDVKSAVAEEVGISPIDMTVSRGVANNIIRGFCGPHLPPLKDTATLEQCDIVNVSTLVINRKPITQRDVLLDLYIGCGGQNWTKSTNWGSERPLKEWHGVICNTEGAITTINLGSNKLTGCIPTSLGNLQELGYLSLHNNQLTGAIPASLGNLQHLRFLYLSDNKLTGAIPESLCSLQRLECLYLDRNQLSGTIPFYLGNLQNLLSLILENNQLSGAIPAELGNLQQLERLALRGNPGLDVEGAQVIAALRARDVVVE